MKNVFRRRMPSVVSTWLIAVCSVGCVVTSVTYPVVGQFDDYNEILIGEVYANLYTGTSVIRLEAANSGFSCSGTSRLLYTPSPGQCAGQIGVANLTCSDGRLIKVDWEGISCTRGFGTGFDQYGNRLSFAFGMNEAEALAYIEEAREIVADKPDLPAYRPKETRAREGFASGTGFFVSSIGHLITNFHVVEDANEISISWEGKLFPATVVSLDSANDVALLKIEANTPAIPVSSSSQLERGEEIMTLGYPLIAIQGQSQKASFGRVNSLSGIQDDIRFIQLDAPIQPGNSGGPLLDKKGNVVGVVTATLNQLVTLQESGSLPQNVNYAVKSDYVLPILPGANLSPLHSEAREFPDVVRMSESAVVLVIVR